MKKPFSKLFGLKNKDDIIGYTEEERNNNVVLHNKLSWRDGKYFKPS